MGKRKISDIGPKGSKKWPRLGLAKVAPFEAQRTSAVEVLPFDESKGNQQKGF